MPTMNSLSFNVLPRLALGLLFGCALAMSALSAHAQLRCNEEESPALQGRDAAPVFASADPRGQLLELVNLALSRSKQLGAANLLAQAARNDWEEAAAARLPVLQAQASTSAAGQQVGGVRQNQGQAQAGLNMSMPLWDAGRIAQTAAWRSQLAEAARQGLISSEQQLAAQVVSYSLDRGRLLLQAQVYRQYTKRMACLVDALEAVVKADKGRASELTQAQKSQMTAELSMEQTRSDLRVVEVRLKRLVGESLPASASYASLLNQLPDLPGLQEAALQSSDVKQMEASSLAQERYASVVAAQSKPQVSLGMGATGTGTSTGTRAAEWSAGVTVTVPIYAPGLDASKMAAQRRADASKLQLQDALSVRNYQLQELHLNAAAALERARRIVDILRASERLRSATMVQWQQMGRRSLFDVMGAESDYYSLRVAHISALSEAQQAVLNMWSLGPGVTAVLR